MAIHFKSGSGNVMRCYARNMYKPDDDMVVALSSVPSSR